MALLNKAGLECKCDLQPLPLPILVISEVCQICGEMEPDRYGHLKEVFKAPPGKVILVLSHVDCLGYQNLMTIIYDHAPHFDLCCLLLNQGNTWYYIGNTWYYYMCNTWYYMGNKWYYMDNTWS